MDPSIIIIGGIPGTGKTTLANLLSGEIGATCFNKDKIEAAILRRGIADKDSLNGVGYEILAELAQDEIHHRRSVILDCVASLERVEKFWPNIINQNIRYIECICSNLELHKNRIDGRSRNIAGWYEIKWSDILMIKETYQPFSKSRLILDSANNLNENVQKAVNYALNKSM